ncbi:MAG: sigma-54-dependent transcriptional regulator [Thiotrichales bacterium]
MKEVLIVEDDAVLSRFVAQHVRGMDLRVGTCGRWSEVDRYLEQNEPALVISDMRLPDGELMQRLPQLAESYPVIVLTAYGSIRNAVEAIKAGATEYLVKPVSPEELSLVIRKVLDADALRVDHQFCKRRLRAHEGSMSYMIGESPALLDVRQLIEAVAPSEMTVLIQGESGTGKELVARALHDASTRLQRNFVAVDCCTLQETLFESELFGHERGAFTGADKQKKGLIEAADGGTLFLDEIGEIGLTLQAKLLRVLETGIYRRLGGVKDLRANVRVVAATNRDLEAMSREGQFRQDLYFRLSAFGITTPPLRDRRQDIPHLVEHFLSNHDFSSRIDKRVSQEAMHKLIAHQWPGNIRELKNAVERAMILSRGKPRIGVEHLAFLGRRCAEETVNLAFDHDPSLNEVEARYLEIQLRKFSGHRSKVAQVLGISERNVYRLIKRHNLNDVS